MSEAVRKRKLWILSGTVLLLIFVLGTYFNSNKSDGKTIAPRVWLSQQQVIPTPSPFPFQEMTIPYLRKQSFQSSLGELKRVNENQNYISYVTNYDSDGLRINGLLTQPTGQMPQGGWPGIVFVHGYIPPRQYQTLQNYVSYVDFLARNGFVVFKIDLRGYAESEGEPGGAYYSADYIVDTLSAYTALQSATFVNPQRIGLWGHSMAGNVVFRSFTAKPEIPAIAIWAGAVYSYRDFREYGISDGSFQPFPTDSERARKRRELFEKYGDFNPDSSFWKQVTPTNYLQDLKGAIQIHHAVNDTVVSIKYSRDVMALLDGTSIVHELHEYPEGGHNIAGASFTQAMQRTVDFFKKYL